MISERFSEVSFVVLPPMRVACYRAIGRTPEDDAAKVLRHWAVAAGLPGRPRAFGFDVEVSAAEAADGWRGYELWYVITDDVQPTPPISTFDFPGGRYAAMTIHEPFADPFTHIPTGWQHLNDWVAEHLEGQAGERLCLEEVVEVEGREDMILYYPVA